MFYIGIDIGWVGFGGECGKLPNVRLGMVRFWWLKKSLFAQLSEQQAALKAAAEALTK
jgi:hypothetical protein